MSEDRLRKDITRLKLLNNGEIPEFYQDIEDVLNKLEKIHQENQQLKEREQDIINKYLHATKYASEQEDKAITYKSIIDETREQLLKFNNNSVCIINEKEMPTFTKALNFHEVRILLWTLLEILDKVNIESEGNNEAN